jgi:hypothetical protein
MSALFEGSSFPEAERFCLSTPAKDRDTFDAFMNVCNRCFIEPIEALGRRIGKKDYFWKDVKVDYPELWQALNRVKAYRNAEMHLELNSMADASVREYLLEDLGGRRLSQVPEVYFMLQQIVTDEMFVALQCEMDRLSN